MPDNVFVAVIISNESDIELPKVGENVLLDILREEDSELDAVLEDEEVRPVDSECDISSVCVSLWEKLCELLSDGTLLEDIDMLFRAENGERVRGIV